MNANSAGSATKLAKIETQLSMTKIIAPRDGLVVYATSVQGGGRHRMSEPLQEGQAVRERQELIYLPSARLHDGAGR